MPGLLLHVGAITNCFHQTGVVSASPVSPPRVMVNDVQPVLTISDLHKVVGCLFTVPGPKAQPCVTVRVEAATRVMVNGQPVAILTPAALCLSAEQVPQGIPNSAATQKRVIAT
jgi:hypothetical protein